MITRTWLLVAAALETASLAVLLINLFTVHARPVTSAIGPIHGMCYLAVIALAFALELPIKAKALAAVPVIGGFLAVRSAGPPDG